MTDLCRHFDTMIARAPQLTTEEAAKLEAHLAGCRECRELARVRSVDDVALAATGMTETVLSNAPTTAGHEHEHELAADTTDRYRLTGEVGRAGSVASGRREIECSTDRWRSRSCSRRTRGRAGGSSARR